MHQHVPGMGEDMAVSKRGAFCHPAQRHILPDVFRQQLRMPRLRHRIRHGGSPLGPWTKSEHNPILQSPGTLQGCGHHAVFRDKRHRYRVVFHAHHAPGQISPRIMHFTRLKFIPQKIRQTGLFSAGLFYPTINKGLNPHGSTRSETAISSFLRKAFGKVADTRPLRMIASSAVRQLPTETLK